MSHPTPSSGVSTRARGRWLGGLTATSFIALLAVAGLALATTTSCEDEVIESGSGPRPNPNAKPGPSGAAPPPAPQAGGGAARSAAPAAAAAAPDDPALDDLPKPTGGLEGDTPEPDDDAIVVQLHTRNPLAVARIVGPLADTPVDAARLADTLATFYGFDTLTGLALDQPAAAFWLDDSAVPVVVVTVKHAGEVMSGLPEPVVDRQGNAFSFSFGVTRTAYINFFGPADTLMAITGDRRHWPRAGDAIREVVTGELPDDLLARGHADLTRIPALEGWLEGLTPPWPMIAPGWDGTRNDLEVLLGSTATAELEVRSDGEAHRVDLRLTPATEQGGLRTFVRDAEVADPADLFARLPDAVSAAPRAWLWQDLRHAPLDLDALPGTMISPFVALEPSDELTAVRNTEVARARALEGATLTVQSGFGDDERLAMVAPIEDRAAFDTANAARLAAIDSFAGAERIENVDALPAADGDDDDELPTASWPPDATALQITPGDEMPPLFGLEWVRQLDDEGHELVGLARRGAGELALPAERTGGSAPPSLTTILATVAGARPMLLWVADLALSPEEQADPIMLGIFTTGEQLAVHLTLPQTQLVRLGR